MRTSTHFDRFWLRRAPETSEANVRLYKSLHVYAHEIRGDLHTETALLKFISRHYPYTAF